MNAQILWAAIALAGTAAVTATGRAAHLNANTMGFVFLIVRKFPVPLALKASDGHHRSAITTPPRNFADAFPHHPPDCDSHFPKSRAASSN